MFSTLKKVFSLLTREERWHACWIFLAMTLMALFDVVGIASVMPFMAVITNPTIIQQNTKISMIYHLLHFTSPYHFMVFLGISVFVLCVVGNAFTMLTTWLILNFANLKEYTLSRRLLANYLHQPYSFFLNRNVSELSKNILSEVNNVTINVLIPGMELIAKSIVTFFIFSLLFFMDTVLAISVICFFGGIYAGIYFSVRRKLGNMSDEISFANRGKFKHTTEALSGIKDIKLLHKEQVFLDQYSVHAKKHASHRALADVIFLTPRYALEAVAFGGILLIVIYLLLTKKNVSDAIAYVSLYAFACFRLMPALQQIFAGFSRIRTSHKATTILYHDLISETHQTIPQESDYAIPALPFNKMLSLNHISFYYPGTVKPIIQQLTLSIPAKTSIGFVGSTGSGKTTTIDLILGLLNPAEGSISIDGIKLDISNIGHWQRNIGYVPQAIYLTDDTITRNIAFGCPNEKIDHNAVIRAAKIANIHDFVIQELPLQYETLVGDRGIRLSGGQRQRLGIARALYRDPDVLVLDEATSALDSMTEAAIMKSIQLLAQQKTIIIVAHRLSTIMKCDQIYLFDQGKILAQGNYDELCASSDSFKMLVQANSLS